MVREVIAQSCKVGMLRMRHEAEVKHTKAAEIPFRTQQVAAAVIRKSEGEVSHVYDAFAILASCSAEKARSSIGAGA